MHADTSISHLMKPPPSLLSNAPMPTECMVSDLKRHTQPECGPLPEVNVCRTLPVERMLLEGMNFRNQGLMMRLGLPLKACPNLPRETCFPSDLDTKVEEPYSSDLPMTKDITQTTTPST